MSSCFSNFEATAGETAALSALPSFGKLIQIPKTSDNYEALNHLLIKVFWEACKTSPPIPKIALPANITGKMFLKPPMEKTVCPITQIKAVSIITILGPFLSIKIPPKSGIIMLGSE